MSDVIQYKYGITSLFRTAKCVNVPAGDFLNVAEAPQDATPVEGSETLVVCPEILMVTAGSFELQVPELPDPIALNAGDISSSQRYRSPITIVATSDNSAYTCIMPRDNSFYEREGGFVGDAQQLTIETPEGATEDWLYVAIGGLRLNGADNLVGALVPVANGAIITGIGNTYFVHMWKML